MNNRDTRCTFLAAMILAASGGCGSIVLVEAGDDSTGPGVGTTADPGTSGPSSGTPMPSTSATTATPTTSPPGTTTGVATTSGVDTGEDDEATSFTGGCGGAGGGGFICSPDGGLPGDPCSVWDQDCPDGEKCTAWANDGGNVWNAHRCVPVALEPAGPGEECTVEGSAVSGIDTCALGSMCFGVDSKTGIGTCTPFCTGSPEQAMCEDPQRYCQIGGDSVLSLCLLNCNPLAPDPCPESEACYSVGEVFTCVPVAVEAGPLEPCEVINGCRSGLMCVTPSLVEGCTDEAAGCCTPYCNVNVPLCPGPNGCIPFYEEGAAPPGYEDVGICGVDG